MERPNRARKDTRVRGESPLLRSRVGPPGVPQMKSVMNAAVIAGLACLAVVVLAKTTVSAADSIPDERPLIAIWRRDEGLTNSTAPCLRVAIWSDGKVLFSKNP